MPASAYVNGRFLSVADAMVHVEDRGFQFADSIYEVVAVLNGRMLDWPLHRFRLRRNAAALFLDRLPSDAALDAISVRLLARARARDALLYLQFTRGSTRRDHGFPRDVRPTLVMTARSFDFRQRLVQQQVGISVVSLPDQRWARNDIKSTGLLPAVLAKQEARAAQAFEAMFHLPGGEVTEGASTNMWLVAADGALVTHPLSARILPGIMRQTAIRLAREAGMIVHERVFTLDEARAAAELLLTSTTAPCLPITRLDGAAVGNGEPGPVAARLAALLWQEVERQTGWKA